VIDLTPMSPEDDKELHRLADVLETIDHQIGPESPLREALVKAGLALSHTFIHDSRSKIEEDYRFLEDLRKKKP
jgi:hypothetical protein